MLIGIAALLAIAQAVSGDSDRLHLWWSGLVGALGLLFLLYMVFHHGISLVGANVADLLDDPQQRQHLTMGVLITLGGAAEYAWARGGSLVWAYPWPLVLVIIAVMFIRHAQHGTHEAMEQSVRFHRILGITLVAAGLFAGSHALGASRATAYLWPLALLAAAAQLVAYREPAGAFEGTGHLQHS